jgi:hypothetical protein
MTALLFLFLIPLVCVLPGVVAVLYGRGAWVISTLVLSFSMLVLAVPQLGIRIFFVLGPGYYPGMFLALLLLGAVSAWRAVAKRQRFDQVHGVARSPRGAFTLALRSVRVVATGVFCLALIAAGIEACVWLSEPPMIRDIVGGLFRSPVKNGKELYQQRVQATFPTKIPEAELLTLLSQQGYDVSEVRNNGQGYAGISSSLGIVCRITWGVTWRVDDAGLISEVKATQYSACL